ncbi:hypothetical protein N9W23_01745 [Paracoccaceae bacterium]|nr:hypothetical protein [Paracoccaceae bacterium]
MSIRIPIFVVVVALVAFMPLRALAEVNLKRLFWPEHEQQNINGLELIASFEDADYASYLFNKLEDKTLLLVEPGKEFYFDGKELLLSEIKEQKLVFISRNGNEYILNLDGQDKPSDVLNQNTEAKIVTILS